MAVVEVRKPDDGDDLEELLLDETDVAAEAPPLASAPIPRIAAGDAVMTDAEQPGEADYGFEEASDHSVVATPLSLRIGRALLIGMGAGWTLFFGWTVVLAGGLPAIPQVPGLVSAWAAPLVLLALAYLLLIRNSRAEAHRFAATAGLLRIESQMLQDRMANMAQDMAAARDLMEQQADRLVALGSQTTERIEGAASVIAVQAEAFERSTAQAQRAGDALSGRFHSLEQVMPQIEDRSTRIAEQLLDSTQSLTERLEMLERLVLATGSATEDTRGVIGAASKSLAAQLDAIRERGQSAADELNGLADIASSRISVAADASHDAVLFMHDSLSVQAERLGAIADTARSALTGMADHTVTRFDEHVTAIADRLADLERAMEAQVGHAQALQSGLESGLDSLTDRFAAMESDGIARNERLGLALSDLTQDADRMNGALTTGNATADLLIERTEKLLLALDAGTREIDETLPLALERLDVKLDGSGERIATNAAEVERLEAAAGGLVSRIHDAGDILGDQAAALDALLDRANVGFLSNRDNVEQLRAAVVATDADVRRLSDEAGPQLINALLRVKETADSAAQRAKETLSRAIPEAAQALGDASGIAMERAVTDKVAEQMTDLAALAERAVETARMASDRLTGQLLTIGEASENLEHRIGKADEAARERDRDSFARRSAMLIDSLNSRAIDVAKFLSTDVSDSTWAAYLKGDRGVFTRRAVRLIDTGEMRQITTLYNEDREFQDHVNRYIHDFEAMLRGLLSARDGSALGVTMLSSDIGKLYVALAQAIDRLRH